MTDIERIKARVDECIELQNSTGYSGVLKWVELLEVQAYLRAFAVLEGWFDLSADEAHRRMFDLALKVTDTPGLDLLQAIQEASNE